MSIAHAVVRKAILLSRLDPADGPNKIRGPSRVLVTPQLDVERDALMWLRVETGSSNSDLDRDRDWLPSDGLPTRIAIECRE